MEDTLASRLKQALEDREMSSRELSRRAKLNETAVRDIIAGRSKAPRYTTVKKIVSALGGDWYSIVPPSELRRLSKDLDSDDLDLSLVVFSGSTAREAKDVYSKADLIGDFTETNLEGANLTDSNLSEANLRNANLRNTNLTRSNFSNANLEGADLSSAILDGTNFTGARLTGANLTGVDLTRAIWGKKPPVG